MSVNLQSLWVCLPFFLLFRCLRLRWRSPSFTSEYQSWCFLFLCIQPAFGGPCFHITLWFSQRSNVACYVLISTTTQWSGFLKSLHGPVRYLPVCLKKETPKTWVLKTFPMSILWHILLNSEWLLFPCPLKGEYNSLKPWVNLVF